MAKKEIDTSHLNAQQFRELVQVQKDVFYFSTFAYVVHPVRGKTRFLLYPYQKSVLYCFLKHRFNIILKFRQAGITELISLYCLWLTMYHPNKKVNIISIKDSVAKKVLKKIKYMYKNLPEHLKVPIVNGRMGELGTACITGDTMILGTKTDFPIQSIAPSEKGYLDVSGLNIRVLTENGTFERIMKTFNKGKLKTYTIVNDRGLTLRCTPKHKLLTTKGWKTVGEILKNNLTVIFKDTKELVNLAPPKVEKPVMEEIRETNIPGYWVSNLGRVFTTKTKKGKGHGRDGINPYGTELRVMVTMVNRHERVKLTYKGSRRVYSVHRLVWEAFKGPIPEGMIIDHINGNGCCNWITNLQAITYSENTRRAFTMNRALKQSVRQTETLSYKQIGRVKELLKRDKYLNREIAKRVSGGDKDLLDPKKVSRISRGKNCSDIYISKITKVDTTLETIYDMEVENYHSYITTNGYINHNSTVEFINGSFIESIPTSEEAGRSESLTLLVIDEAAIVRWASQIWSASFPTLSCSVGSTPILLRSYEEIKKGYPKPITEKVKLRSLCPKEKGILDISNLGYYTLTHTGQWKKILMSQNKGKLETWFVKDCKGRVGGYTPKHKLFTTQGWKTVEEIIDQDLNIIQADTKIDRLKKPSNKVTKPKEEIIKPIEGFEDYFVSNLGKVYCNSSQKGFYELPSRPNKDGYLRVALKKKGVKRGTGTPRNRNKGKTFQSSVHVLVAETFLGKRPKGYQVDHINCVRSDNYVTNLRYMTPSENVSRSFKHNLNAILFGISGSKLPDLIKRGRILEMAQEGFSYREIAKEVYPGYKQAHKFVKRILTERGSRVYISKLKIVKKTLRTIYDIHVEDDHSYISANNFINHNTGGSAILNSTPYGISGFYHSKWVEAITDSDSPFHPIRLYWKMHPERDQKWYDTMSKALGPRRTAQEIDGDFLSSGSTVFDLTDIKAIEDTISEYPVIETRFNGQLRIMDKPKQGVRYFIGADVATGRSNDYSAFTLGDSNGEEAAVFKGRIPVEKYAKILGNLGKEFNWATIAPETNDIGLAVTTLLQTEGYPQLYYHKKLLKKKGKSRPEVEQYPGWITTSKNRSLIIDGLEEDIRKDNITIKDPFFVQEAYTFIYDSIGRPVAMGKHNRNNQTSDIDMDEETYSDDSIFGKAIYNHVRKNYKPSLIIQPK